MNAFRLIIIHGNKWPRCLFALVWRQKSNSFISSHCDRQVRWPRKKSLKLDPTKRDCKHFSFLAASHWHEMLSNRSWHNFPVLPVYKNKDWGPELSPYIEIDAGWDCKHHAKQILPVMLMYRTPFLIWHYKLSELLPWYKLIKVNGYSVETSDNHLWFTIQTEPTVVSSLKALF